MDHGCRLQCRPYAAFDIFSHRLLPIRQMGEEADQLAVGGKKKQCRVDKGHSILRGRWIWVDVFSAPVLTTYAKTVEAAGGSFCRPPSRVPAAMLEISSLCDQEKGTFGCLV